MKCGHLTDKEGAIVTTDWYSVHGLAIRLLSDDPDVASAIASRLRAFTAVGDKPDMTFTVRVAGDVPAAVMDWPWGEARPVYESDSGQIRYADGQDLLLLDGRDGRAVALVGTGEVTMYAPRAATATAWLLSHPFLTIPMMETFKRRSVFAVHAGGVAGASGAILLAGPSGAGKTTLTVALVRQGLAFLGDDLTFLVGAEPGGRLELLPFPDEIDLLDDASDYFPEVRSALARERPEGWPKYALRLEDVISVQSAERCTPTAVVLLGPRSSGTPALESLAAEDALLELVPNVLLTEPASSQAHLDALGRLTRECPCYLLHAGPDILQNARTVASLIN